MLQQIQPLYAAVGIVFLSLCTGIATGQGLSDIRITEVDEQSQWLELVNTGNAPVDVSDALLCANFQYPLVGSLSIRASDETGDGDFVLDPGEFVALDWGEVDADNGDLGLYDRGTNNFGNSDTIIDYVRWGASGADREDVAVDAGIWTQGATVEAPQDGATLAFLGDDAAMNDAASDWGEGNPTPGAQNTVLPVELTSFDALANDTDVVLSWRTASETNNAGFEVQRKTEDTFSALGFVEGAGTTPDPQQYRFRVTDLPPGTHVFRLKQIDVGGGFEFSPTVEVAVNLRETRVLSDLRPNPSRGPAQFTLAVQSSQTVRVNVYDALGRHVQTVFEGRMTSGQINDLVVHGDRLSSGMYFVRIVGDRFADTRKLVIAE